MEKKEKQLDEEVLKKIFSNKILNLSKAMDDIFLNFKGIEYSIMPTEEFKKLKKLEEINYITQLEIIERAHIVALSSIFRTRKWIFGIFISYYNKNYYLFASSLRGLIEAIGDSFYTLKKIPLTLATHFYSINLALKGELTNPFYLKDLEDDLIHYTHARKLKGNEKKQLPDYYNAKQTTEYLNEIKDGNESIIDLYSELCQISHPASNSLNSFLFEEDGKLVLHNSEGTDGYLIESLLSKYKDAIGNTISTGLLSSFIVLKLINKFEYPELFIKSEYLGILDKVDLWKECQELIVKSENEHHKRYKN
ncbi:hypothetical protein [Leptospira bouyouniensis]|uniref:Uncharacterized protein n=1 Tax=Leptospira bouyouniensis TaxID=2484911 RepID=A0ABY2L9S0_9LEPT|nr:hypothetical protein [Leptospira bouyouniensis]TGK54259.1 hypothetical protein EHQ10_00395 [Leptospira bouyouniensis]